MAVTVEIINFDTGPGRAIVQNMLSLGLDPRQITAIALLYPVPFACQLHTGQARHILQERNGTKPDEGRKP